MIRKFSLIMATYGRKDEVGCFLESLMNSNYTMDKVEVIIVDQNKEIDLEPIISKYKEKIYEPPYLCSKCKRALVKAKIENDKDKIILEDSEGNRIRWSCPKCSNCELEYDKDSIFLLWD